MLENFSWFLLIPVWVSLIILGAKFLGLALSKKNIVLLSIISTIFSACYCLYGAYISFSNSPSEFSIPFLSLYNLNFSLGVYVDVLNSLIGLTVSIITFIVYIYSIFYMSTEKSFSRFYSLMNLFNSSILAFIFSPNLFQMLLCWELIGAISYLLIGFWYNKVSVSLDAKRVFLINSLGDILLFSLFIIISYLVVSFSGNENLVSLPFSDLNLITSSLMAATNTYAYSVISLMIVCSAFVKSAQFPINSWLINAMSAPTPVSALIHSSTLVITGVFLLLRLFPIFASDYLSMKLLIIIGLVTGVLTSLAALAQTNIKKILAYSTSAQLGLVMFALGCYNPIVASVYLISHAFIKALLFMCAGVTIKLVNNKNILFMGNFRNCIPIVALCFIVGSIALSGLGFCGFNAKNCVFNSAHNSLFVSTILVIIGILTTLYIFRLYFIVFEKKSLLNCNDLGNLSFPRLYKICYISTLLMSFVVICLSLILPSGRVCFSYIINLFVLILAYFLYCTKFKVVNIPMVHSILINGFYINKIYYWGENIIYTLFTKIMYIIDEYIIGAVEYVVKKTLLFISQKEHFLQSNNFQNYISYGIWILLFAMFIFITLYMFLLNMFGV